MCVPTALGAARNVIKIIDTFDVERDMLRPFHERKIAARIVYPG
jgi:hypothetical protein